MNTVYQALTLLDRRIRVRYSGDTYETRPMACPLNMYKIKTFLEQNIYNFKSIGPKG